jgi:hypothetical protein
MSNELVLKKLFALTQGKPAPKERIMSNVPTVIPRKLRLPRDASIHYQDLSLAALPEHDDYQG